MSLLPDLYEHYEVRSDLGKTAAMTSCDLGSVESSSSNFLGNPDDPLLDGFVSGRSLKLSNDRSIYLAALAVSGKRDIIMF